MEGEGYGALKGGNGSFYGVGAMTRTWQESQTCSYMQTHISLAPGLEQGREWGSR